MTVPDLWGDYNWVAARRTLTRCAHNGY